MKKSRKGLIAVIIIIVLALAGGGAYWYTSRAEYKLGRAGYDKQQIETIKSLFSEAEQEALINAPAQPDIIAVAQSDRYQKDHFEDYLKDLADGRTAEDILHDYDPWVITLRADSRYKEENLELYLAQKTDGTAGDAASLVNFVNMDQLYSKSSEYDRARFEDYEAYRAKFPDLDPEEIVHRVARSGEYLKEDYFIYAYLEKYEAYKEKNPDKSLADVIQAVNAGIDKPFYTEMVTTDMSKEYLIIVNKYNKLPEGYSPKLESLSGYGNGYMEPTAAAAFRKMVEAGREAGVSLRSLSPYRSHSLQTWQYQFWVDAHGQEMADRESARPGSSEHETGLAVDINTAVEESHFERTKEYAWLVEHCWEYGFILRYLPEKEYITGYVYEPWHYRYVGVEHAEKIMKLGITYEEYYAYYINNPDYPETGGPVQ
ncbi:MAG: M15 family metallopeptidase [Firmicutes bacterium]|nr:M15 family metallopeptidase [Bacillota bacterium]